MSIRIVIPRARRLNLAPWSEDWRECLVGCVVLVAWLVVMVIGLLSYFGG